MEPVKSRINIIEVILFILCCWIVDLSVFELGLKLMDRDLITGKSTNWIYLNI